MPWDATPRAKPRTAVARKPGQEGMASTAPKIPVAITSTAVSEGMPPMRSPRPAAMGVADFGAGESTVGPAGPGNVRPPPPGAGRQAAGQQIRRRWAEQGAYRIWA